MDEVDGRAIRRRAQVLLVGDTVRLVATVLVVGAGDALVARAAGWWVLAVLLTLPFLVVLVAVSRSDRPGADPEGSSARSSIEGGAVDLLDADALDAVLLHESHHLRPASRRRATAWLVATAAATTLLVPVSVPLLALSVLGLVRAFPLVLVAVLAGPASLGGLLWRELGPPVALLLWPTRLRAAATHRRELLADLSAAAVVGPAALLRALRAMEAVLPAPAEVDAARVAGSPSAVPPRTGRCCTVPLHGGEGSVRLAALRWSLWRRCRALALLGGVGEGG